MQRINIIVSQHLQEFDSIFRTTPCGINLQRVEAAAVGGSQTRKLQELAAVSICRHAKVSDRERLKVGASSDELAQRPLVQGVLVCEFGDSKLFEAVFFVDGTA